MSGPQVDAARVIADLRELDRRTGGPGGARRVAWGEEWRAARSWFAELAGELGLEGRRDQAGNVRFTLAGEARPGLALGSHLDSVPAGGWLDGALGVMAGLGVLRAWAESGERPPRDLVLVDWADEEGSRFGYSLFGSSAFAGVLQPDAVSGLRDHDGVTLADALAADDVEIATAGEATGWRDEIGAYLELHIEQGPVLESESGQIAAVEGCVGIERRRLRFSGQAAHAGTTPMELRNDAGLAAAETALAVERIANEHGGVGTTGELSLRPGIITAVAGEAELGVDLRHSDRDSLGRMYDEALSAAARRGRQTRLRARGRPRLPDRPDRVRPRASRGGLRRLPRGRRLRPRADERRPSRRRQRRPPDAGGDDLRRVQAGPQPRAGGGLVRYRPGAGDRSVRPDRQPPIKGSDPLT